MVLHGHVEYGAHARNWQIGPDAQVLDSHARSDAELYRSPIGSRVIMIFLANLALRGVGEDGSRGQRALDVPTMSLASVFVMKSDDDFVQPQP